jgi:hypothetical protein
MAPSAAACKSRHLKNMPDGTGDDRNGDGQRITSSRLAGMPRAAPIAGVALAR